MKTIILTAAVASLIAIVTYLGASRIELQRVAADECQVSHYTCFRPAVSFASLH